MELIEKLIRKYGAKSLEELERQVWSEENYTFSSLTHTCFKLRNKPLGSYEVEDLRIMIGQNLSLGYLMPFAIRVLQKNILAEGDYYPGDLLGSILNIKEEFWKENEDFKSIIRGLISANMDILIAEKIDISKFK